MNEYIDRYVREALAKCLDDSVVEAVLENLDLNVNEAPAKEVANEKV